MNHNAADTTKQFLRIVLTGGGSAGHVTPNLALAKRLKEKGFEIFYIGSHTGLEKQLVESEGIKYQGISAGKLRRYFDWQNVIDVFKVVGGLIQALIVLKRLKPDVVFSKGGFVSCPVVWAAWLINIPVVVHESDITPGLANRLSAPFAKKICYSFPETKDHVDQTKGVLSGIPIRDSILTGSVEAGLKLCAFSNSKPIILVIGGSLGSAAINAMIRSSLAEITKEFQICHICGKANVDTKLNGVLAYAQFEYVHDALADLYAMSDLVIARAGATTLFELLALKKPHLLIPLPASSSRGDQILNAASFKKLGYSEVLAEEDLNGETLLQSINYIYKNKTEFIQVMSVSSSQDPLEIITTALVEQANH